jgi:hypothetical protein
VAESAVQATKPPNKAAAAQVVRVQRPVGNRPHAAPMSTIHQTTIATWLRTIRS